VTSSALSRKDCVVALSLKVSLRRLKLFTNKIVMLPALYKNKIVTSQTLSTNKIVSL
jgi:hypothetical protein